MNWFLSWSVIHYSYQKLRYYKCSIFLCQIFLFFFSFDLFILIFLKAWYYRAEFFFKCFRNISYNWLLSCSNKFESNSNLLDTLRRRGHWSYTWRYCLSFFCVAAKAGYQNWSELSSWQYRSSATWGVHLHNYLLAESPRRLFARRFTTASCSSPFFFSFTPKLFFKTSLVSLLLPRGLPPALFVRTLSARRLLPPFFLPTRLSHRSVSICSLFLLRHRLCRRNILRVQ